MGYDEAYRKTEDYFGPGATSLLMKHHHLISKARPVLDIGAGQGRNTLLLARNRFMVDAIDPSQAAIDTIDEIVAKERIPVRTYCCGHEDFAPEADSYSAILIFGLIQILTRESIDLLLEQVRAWTDKGSLVFTTAFTTADPRYPEHRENCRSIGTNSFLDEDGNIFTYLEPDETKKLFSEYEVIHHWEGMSPRHRHGDGPMEQHGMVEAIFQR
jgi:cyclopropane fatty-acyl-phospholipid synthase-like methyltransferase